MNGRNNTYISKDIIHEIIEKIFNKTCINSEDKNNISKFGIFKS